MDDSALPLLAPYRRLPAADRPKVAAELLRRYEAGQSIRDIAAGTGYSISRTRRLLEDAGVAYRRRGGPNRARRP